MPSKPRPGKKGLYVELPEDLDTAFRDYCDGRGLKLADEVRLAILRHLANPPPLRDLPPLPPMTATQPPAPEPPPAPRKKPAAKPRPKKKP